MYGYRYFGDSTNVDWSNPGGLFSLVNMIVLGALVFSALVALERINNETTKLLKKLDIVAVNVARISSVKQSVEERNNDDIKEEEEHSSLGELSANATDKMGEATRVFHRRKYDEFQKEVVEQDDRTHAMLREAADAKRELMFKVKEVINRQEVVSEYQYLINIMSELRDSTTMIRIIGVAIDRPMLTRIFGGVIAVLYVMLKHIIDTLVAKYSPAAGIMAATMADPNADGST